MLLSSGRTAYKAELANLEHDLLVMASRAEQMVAQAVDSLARLDTDLAHQTIESDDEIDALELALEERCIRLLALQQPIGQDLRTIGTTMKVVTDIERIADLAVDVAKITLKVDSEFGEVGYLDFAKYSNAARAMFRMAMESYVRSDPAMVQSVCEADDEVDQLYRDFRGEIFANMREHPEQVVSDGWLLLAIHHLERIGDHAVNIAERVNFMITGEFRPLKKGPFQDRQAS